MLLILASFKYRSVLITLCLIIDLCLIKYLIINQNFKTTPNLNQALNIFQISLNDQKHPLLNQESQTDFEKIQSEDGSSALNLRPLENSIEL